MFALIRAANELAQLSNFAGRQLGFANYQLWKSGSLLPFGMAVAVSFWKGATNQITIIRVEDPKLIAQAAVHWFDGEHKGAKWFGAALDTYITLEGSRERTSAVCVTVAPADRSTRLLIFQPYTPATTQNSISFDFPLINAPPEHSSVLSQRSRILDHVLKGRRAAGVPKVPASHYRT